MSTAKISQAAAVKPPHVSKYPMTSAEVDSLVRELVGRLADKWTMLILESLEEHGRTRFSRLSEHVGGVSQKMLTKTLRQMESDGLVRRTVYPVIPPHVDYELTELGQGLTGAFCSVWLWVEAHHQDLKAARQQFLLSRQAGPVQPRHDQPASRGPSSAPPAKAQSTNRRMQSERA